MEEADEEINTTKQQSEAEAIGESPKPHKSGKRL